MSRSSGVSTVSSSALMGLTAVPSLPFKQRKPGLRVWAAVTLAKLAGWASKALGKGAGTSLPGLLALRVAPSSLKQLAHQLPLGCWAITGTNGKTTTAGLLSLFLRAAGYGVLHNQLGSNMKQGLMTALALQSNGTAELAEQLGVLEIDEASLPKLSKELPLQGVLVTNLFRDQLDRYGELDTTGRMIASSFEQAERWVALNADDPLVANLGRAVEPGKAVIYFGLEGLPEGFLPTLAQQPEAGGCLVPFPNEVTDCPLCGTGLTYTLNTLAHLGHYQCGGCGYKRPSPRFLMRVSRLTPSESELMVEDTLGEVPSFCLSTPLPGLYNLYNLAAAVTLATLHGVSPEAMQAVLSQYSGVFGRAEERQLGGRTIRVLLIKNPAGASQVLSLVAQDPEARVLIAINDAYADGRDVSWLWDAEFERLTSVLQQSQNLPIWVSGNRAEDMAVRLKYAGLPEEAVAIKRELLVALQEAVKQTPVGGTLYVLPTYTALLHLNTLWGEV